MPASMHGTQVLIEKIQSLPVDRIAEVEDFVDFLRERVRHRRSTSTRREPLAFPVDDLGPWPDSLSLRREELYGDDGC